MGITIDEAITRYKNNAEYERTHGNLQGCLEFRQLAKWLEQLQKIEEAYKKYQNDMVTNIYADGKFIKALIEVLEDGERG